MSPTEVEVQQRNRELPAGWARTKFGEVYELAYGKSLTKGVRNANGKYPVYGSNGIVGYHDIFLVEGPALVVGRKGAAGVVSLSTKSCWPIDTTYYVRDSGYVDIRFSFYFLTSLRLSQFDRSTAIPGLNRDDVYDLVICLPPLPEQHRIVTKVEELFSELDKGVESLEKAREQLKVYRQAVLKHAFEGKLTAKWREENQDKLEKPEQLLARIKREREARYEQLLEDWKDAIKEWDAAGRKARKPHKPQKPKIPDLTKVYPAQNPFWVHLSLDDLAAEAVLGKMLDREKNTGTPRYYLANINLRWGKFDLDNLKTIKVKDNEIKRYSLERGDLVICEGGEPGRCAVWEGKVSNMIIQKALHRIRFTDSYNSHFAYYFMLYAASSGQLSPYFTGSTIKHLTGKGLRNVLFPLCTLAEQKRITHLLCSAITLSNELDCQIERNIQYSNFLRQSILRKAFSGKLVAQDPYDEPASLLLKRIKAEKAAQSHTITNPKRRRRTAAGHALAQQTTDEDTAT